MARRYFNVLDIDSMPLGCSEADIDDIEDGQAQPDSDVLLEVDSMLPSAVVDTIIEDLLLPIAQLDDSEDEFELLSHSSGSGKSYTPSSSCEDSDDKDFDSLHRERIIDNQAAMDTDGQQQAEPQPGCSSWETPALPQYPASKRQHYKSPTAPAISSFPYQSHTPSPQPSLDPHSLTETWTPVGDFEQQENKGKFMVNDVGPRDIGNCRTPLEFFFLFMTATVWQNMVDATNRYARATISTMIRARKFGPRSRLRYWRDVTLEEMKKFWAILLNMGICRRPNISAYWSTDDTLFQNFFQDQMTQFRFEIIMSQFQVCTRTVYLRDNVNHDPWVKIRDFIDELNNAFKRHFVPSQEVCIDESLIGMKNKYVFMQYMPNKRHSRFGIRKFELCDSASRYVMHVALYCDTHFLQEKPDLFTQKVLTELMEQTGLLDKYYHLFTDNYYTKIPLVDFLYKRKTFITGPINKKSCLLDPVIKNGNVSTGDFKYFKRGSVLLVKYKELKKKEPMLLISSAYAAENKEFVSKSGIRNVKPMIIYHYNQHIGRVDDKYKNIYHLTFTRVTKKYWKKVVYNFVDIALYNAYHLYKFSCSKPISKLQFITEIVRDLTQCRSINVTIDIPKRVPVGQLTTDHVFQRLERRNQMKCAVCSKRALFWCPGCNVGVHEKCLSRLRHFKRRPSNHQMRIAGVRN